VNAWPPQANGIEAIEIARTIALDAGVMR
jgi:hypothetical protein